MLTRAIGPFAAACVAFACIGAAHAAPPDAPPETTTRRIVVIRHGEKPDAGLGQLACRGLVRALALPDVLLAQFGTPQFLIAPNPAKRKPDHGHLYAYIRPLATIEPLAIRVGLPVEVQFGFDEVAALARSLGAAKYAGALTIVAWEHRLAPVLVRDLLARHGGDAKLVETWKDDDFDRIDAIEITTTPGQKPSARYTRSAEGLNGLPGECPGAKKL